MSRRYLSRAIEDGTEPDGTRFGHYGDPVPVSEVADDYGRLTVARFDAKYPGWHNDRAFMDALRDEFHRREVLDTLPSGHIDSDSDSRPA